jgi:hypothetical protein
LYLQTKEQVHHASLAPVGQLLSPNAAAAAAAAAIRVAMAVAIGLRGILCRGVKEVRLCNAKTQFGFWYNFFYLPAMADDALDARRGNLYGISTLSGNWFEDRIQHTKGSTTDGLRGDKYTFEDGNNNSVVRQKESAISVCLIPDKNTGKAVGIASAERYRRAANNPTTRVFPGCKEGTLATTSTYASAARRNPPLFRFD